MGTRRDEQPGAGKEHKRADATSRHTFKVWAEEFMWQEHWARSSPAENGCVSTLSKSCSSNVEAHNVSSEDLGCIPTNKNIMFLHIILFSLNSTYFWF